MKYDYNDLESLFRAISHMYHNCIRKEFEKREINHANHPPILFILKHESGNIASQKDIADKLGISPPTVAISIKRMVKVGLLQKVADESDLRRNFITLTEKGKRLVEESELVFDTIDQGMFRGFSQDDREQLKSTYLRIISNLEIMGAQPPEFLKKGNEK